MDLSVAWLWQTIRVGHRWWTVYLGLSNRIGSHQAACETTAFVPDGPLVPGKRTRPVVAVWSPLDASSVLPLLFVCLQAVSIPSD